MRIQLASVIAGKDNGTGHADEMAREYIGRAAKFQPAELSVYPSENALLDACVRQPNRPAAALILFDSRGEQATSVSFAEGLRKLRDGGQQRIVYAIGPADGWSETARRQALTSYSLGRFTLPHKLARAVAAEQIYRALTILAGHPYHVGH